jgi:hypothetical protein
MTGIMGAASVASLIITPIFFLIGVGILHMTTTLLGGKADFGNYAYLIAAFQAPLNVLGSLLGFVPGVGACLGAILSIYGLVLTYFATKAAYGLTSGRAMTVVFIPVLIVLLLVVCIFVTAFGLLMLSTSSSSP